MAIIMFSEYGTPAAKPIMFRIFFFYQQTNHSENIPLDTKTAMHFAD